LPQVAIEGREMAEQAGNGSLPLTAAQFLSKPAEPPPSSEASRPNGHTAAAHTPLRAEDQQRPRASGNAVDLRTMVVGKETAFSGKIVSCSRLIVEGLVEATLGDCQHVIVNETGTFKGDSSTENADIYGSFEGRLNVRKRLLVRATGRVSGTITYGEIEIERGGKIAGTIRSHDGPANAQTGRPAVAKGLAMNRGRRKSVRAPDYSQPELSEKSAPESKDSAAPEV
jgi:cytoskeletal protein CcmA (bactofilin family)